MRQLALHGALWELDQIAGALPCPGRCTHLIGLHARPLPNS